MNEELIEIVIYVEGMPPLELACTVDNEILAGLCAAWATRGSRGEEIMSLQLGEDQPRHFYFKIADMSGLESSVPLPGHLFEVASPLPEADYSHLDINPVWVDWVRKNLERGNPPDKLYRYMFDKGVEPGAIKELLGYEPAEELPITEREDRESILPLKAVGLEESDRFSSEYLELYVIEDFVDEETMDLYESLVDGPGERSTVYGKKPINEGRTSNTIRLPNAGDVHPAIRDLQHRLCDLLDSRMELAEPFTCQVYEQGQQFRAHKDYYDDEGAEAWYESCDGTQRRGQRQWSVLIYLTDAPEGSGTRFHRIREEFRPGRGTALIWNNLYPSGRPNHYTHHSGLPVHEGRKLIVTQMFRAGNPGD